MLFCICVHVPTFTLRGLNSLINAQAFQAPRFQHLPNKKALRSQHRAFLIKGLKPYYGRLTHAPRLGRT
ncbi:hypothetical protein AcetOrient_orf01090 [Acetobacter orientalis]|uniref:Uncharacterized protein n=1 Tax=Acetobacter orientalis TaxID=146474 RepID=A0A2Z5ZF23_9PROT|nr:hypothetical protein AcetOrient_orf01090 [Acetobacter orientalis]